MQTPPQATPRPLHTRPSPSGEYELKHIAESLRREVEAQAGSPCTVRISRRRGWPDPHPVTEVIVQAADVAMLTRHRDPHTALIRAFQAVLDRFPQRA
jgi:hypothetical protein